MGPSEEVRDEAYARLHAWGPEFGDDGGENGLSNHGPMAVEVLARRGLADRVEPWVDRYVKRLETMPPASDPITEATWAEAMGVRARVGDWTAYFVRAVADRPWREVLVEWWPRLLPAIASASTHGLIRTGHAVAAIEAGDDSQTAVDEVAHALGYWAARAILVPGLVAPSGDLDADEALETLPRLAEQSGVIRQRFARLGDLPGWSAGLARLRPPTEDSTVAGDLGRLVETGVRRYVTCGHASPVLLVHVATAPNAMLKLLPVLPETLWRPSFDATWAACAAITAAYAPGGPQPVVDPIIVDPDDIMSRAADHGDEHVIKLSDTVLDAYARHPDPALLQAAARSAELIASPR